MEFLPVDELKPGMKLSRDILAFHSGQLSLLRKGQVLTEHFIQRLIGMHVDGVYIDDDSESENLSYGMTLDKQTRTEAVDSVETFFNDVSDLQYNGQAPQSIRQIHNVVGRLVDTVQANRNVLVNISDLKSYDDYTYHHSVSVSLLSLAIGMYMDMPKSMLRRLGVGSILHDIGKIMVPLEILNKPGRLTTEEFSVVKEHPLLGAQYIREKRLAEEDVVRAVLEHHEKVDGTGYPFSRKRKDICLFARIISVVDVYDALTSKRPYRSPMPPNEAAEYLMGNAGTSFDFEIVKAFIKKVELYPVGSYVHLSDGRIGLVINNENPLRPAVRIIDNHAQVLDLFRDKNCRNLVITSCYRDNFDRSEDGKYS